MSQLEQNAIYALETRLAAVTEAAERAVIEGIHTAFVRVPLPSGCTVSDAMGHAV